MGKIQNAYRNLKFGNKLIVIFLIVIILPEVVLSAFSAYLGSYSLKNKVMKSTQETTRQMIDNIDNEINNTMNLTMQVTSDRKLKEILAQEKKTTTASYYEDEQYMNNLIDMAFVTSFAVENIYICSYNGMVYTSDKNYLSLRREYDFTRTQWFAFMKRSGTNTMILSTYDRASVIQEGAEKKLFSIVKKIYDENNTKEVGCIIVDLSSNTLGNLLQDMNNNKGQKVVIVDDNKTIVYHPDSQYIGTQFRSDYISDALMQKSGYLESEKENKFVAFSTSEITKWSVIYELEAAALLSDIRNLRIVIIATTLLCIIVSLYLAFTVKRSMTEPITQLQKKMRQVGKGDFDIDADTGTQDEIGQLASSFDKMVKKTKQLIDNVYQSEIYQKEAELNALQAQINPHFLYNTLQTIDMMAEAEGADSISDACQALSKMYRYSINRGQEYVSLKEEISHIKNYMIIQKLRFGKKVDIFYEIETGCGELLIVKLLIQPLVENAVVHGIENSIGKCQVVVRAYQKDETLVIQVEDDGDGIPRERLEQLNNRLENYSRNDIVHKVSYEGTHSSIGLENTNARIKLYFGEEYGIKIGSKEGEGTLVELNLPVKTM